MTRLGRRCPLIIGGIRIATSYEPTAKASSRAGWRAAGAEVRQGVELLRHEGLPMTERSYVGKLFAGRFEVLAALGEGACGTVWRARDYVLGIDVALKVLRGMMRVDPAQRRAFEREARLCERMLSPNIVRVLSFGVDVGDVPYIAYELLAGTSLRDCIGKRAMDAEDVVNVVVQVARGLGRAHSLGVLHRDIKPCNIFLTSDDRGRALAKILDFGIAALTSDVGADGQVSGTFGYMAPEVLFQTSKLDERADLYALTAVAYECLVGRPPIEAASVFELVACFREKTALVPSVEPSVGPAVAAHLDPWFRRGLAREPSARFSSSCELADELYRAFSLAKERRPRSEPVWRDAHGGPRSESFVDASFAPGNHVPAPRPRSPSLLLDAAVVEEAAPFSAPTSRRDPRCE